MQNLGSNYLSDYSSSNKSGNAHKEPGQFIAEKASDES